MGSEDATIPSLVIDNGSGICKVGYAGNDNPNVVFSTTIGRPFFADLTCNGKETTWFVGDDAQSKRGILTLKYPVERGIVSDWKDMEKIWNHAYKLLECDPKDFAVLITETLLNPRVNREKMVEVLFEKFGIPACYVAIPGILSLYAAGRVSGIILDSGDAVTTTTTVWEGYLNKHCCLRLDIAGRDLTEYLMRILRDRHHNFTSSAEKEIIRDVKEKLCYVVLDCEKCTEAAIRNPEPYEKHYELPDGQIITAVEECFNCPEALFQPSHYLGRANYGIHETLYRSIAMADVDLRKTFYESIILTGGTTLLPGMAARIEKELKVLAPAKVKVKVSAPAGRIYSAWIGGSILASLSTFKEMWIHKDEYKETGSSIVHKKCF